MFIFFFLFLLFSITPIKASQEFNFSQKTNYQLDLEGNALVAVETELVNNFSEIYPKNYQILISGPPLENITGTDSKGNIVQKSQHRNDLNIIDLVFNENNLGKDKVTKFSLNYTIPKLAIQKGSIWELSLPENKNNNSQEINEITISVPSSYGNLSFSSLSPKNSIPLSNQTQIYFNNVNQKIFLIFGNHQLFDFNFKYFLKNSSKHPQNLEVVIPPDTDNQKITYREIIPKPFNINIDNDGNWLAQYRLEGNQELEINISGQAKIMPSNIQAKINVDDYLKEQEYWPVNDSHIKQIVAPMKNIKDIYDYTINTLEYDYNAVNISQRKGALNTLISPLNSICTDFTDLFVTLARAKGIAAREVEGFAYTNNPQIKPVNVNADILHAWPQYYDMDRQSWISVDPTWEKTTNGVDYFKDLDPNHFAFVFHGLDSENPRPPGAYKNDRNIKTVEVTFATQELKVDYKKLKIVVVPQKIYQPALIRITNENNNAIFDVIISNPNSSWQHHLKVLPPFSSSEISLPNYSLLSSINPASRNILIQIDSQNTPREKITIRNPKYYLNLIVFAGLIITFFGLGGIILNRNKKHEKNT